MNGKVLPKNVEEVEMTFNIKGASVESNFPTGNFTWTQEFVFDLSGDEPVMTEARIIQEL